MAERGEFHHPARAAQMLSFVGLSFGTITPTDFDLFLDFRGRGFVLGELKYGNTTLQRGQELALERAAEAWHRGGVPTLVLVASHTTDIGDVIVADAEVVRCYWRGRWRHIESHVTVKRAVAKFYAHCMERAA